MLEGLILLFSPLMFGVGLLFAIDSLIDFLRAIGRWLS